MAPIVKLWKNSETSERLPVIVLGLCVAVLVAILVFRPF
jgi:hypothetical protein